MRLKNIMLVLLVGLLVLLVPGTVEASSTGGDGSSFDFTYNCNCKGDYMTYYSDMINSPYLWTSVAHSLNSSTNTYTSCSFQSFCRVTDNMLGEYFLKILVEQSDGTIDLNVGYIYLSSNGIYEFYNADGSTFTKNHNSYTGSNYGGISNGIYYGMWSYIHGSYPYILNYDSVFNYVIECNSSNMRDKMHELAKYLCGETTELPSNVTVGVKQPVYDLEVPLNVSVNGIDNNIFETKSKSVKIRWEQSNIDLSGYKTVFYMRESGRCRKTIFNKWQDVKTPWLFDKDYVTAKYCNNNLKYHEYKWWTDQSKLGDYANAALYGEEKGGLLCEHAAVDFMIRNEKEDSDGVMHYSNWVYVNCFEDGTYQIYEMNNDYTLDEDPDETGNINTDSSIYDDEKIYDEDDVDASLGIGDAKDFVSALSDLINSLRNFPTLFAKIFSFLPSWILAMIGMLFIAALLSRIFK